MCVCVCARETTWHCVRSAVANMSRCAKVQHYTTHCNTLQHTATHCNTLRMCDMTHLVCGINRLHSGNGATHCNTLQHPATYCCILPLTATHHNTLQYHMNRGHNGNGATRQCVLRACTTASCMYLRYAREYVCHFHRSVFHTCTRLFWHFNRATRQCVL